VLWHERTGSGRPIVLLHGLSDDHGLWRHVAPAVADGAEVIAVDLPGHGRSGPIPDGATIGWMAAEVAALLDELDLRDVVLVGLSMGGGVAQTVAIDHPARIGALGLVSTSPRFPDATRERFLARAAVAERDGMAAVVDATVPRWFTPGWMATHPGEVARTTETVLATDPVMFARASRLNCVRDVTARLGEIRVPVLFVGGLEDPADPLRSAPEYEAALPDLRVELVPGVSHLVPVEAPDALVGPLRDLIERRTPQTGVPA
jgi:pimeloyl-ACP methyl ester carboxylesterase